MNIKENRYVIFCGPFFWTLAGMITTRTLEHCFYTIWLACSIGYDVIEMSHNRFKQFSPHQLFNYRNRVLMQNIIMCFIASAGFPSLSLLSMMFINVKSPYKTAFSLSVLWVVWYLCSFWVDYGLLLSCSPRWYGILLFIWSVVHYTMLSQIRNFGKYSTVLHYKNVWLLRFIDQFIINTVRWLLWCDCVFPYQTRWDMLWFGTFLSIICMYYINFKKTSKTFKIYKIHG